MNTLGLARIHRIALALLCLSAARPATSTATSLGLDIVPGCAVKAGQVRVHLRIANRGDEAAHHIEPEAALGNQRASARPLPALDPEALATFTIDLGPAPARQGIHTIAINVRYTDAKGYPFSTRQTVPLVTRFPESTVNPVVTRLNLLTLHSRTGQLTWSATNGTDQAIEGQIRILAPDELRVTPDQGASVLIPAGSHAQRTLSVSNAFGLRGSQYAVFACLDFEQAGIHHSVVAKTRVAIAARHTPLRTHRQLLMVLLLAGLLAEALFLFRQPGVAGRTIREDASHRWAGPILAACLTGLLFYHLHPRGLFLDSMTVGGDIPAHNYLASQLKQQFLASGRLLGWSQGWWAGFPLFQYYFILPYAAVALLSSAIPFNIAFKLVSVAGILCLPACAYLAARRWRLERPAPALLALGMLVLLFDDTHTMWGVNIYSTLSGMIANSWSFAIMLLFMACAGRDADEGRIRLSTVLLFTGLIASHFFTSVMAVVTLSCVPLLRPRSGFRRAAGTLLAEGAMGAMLMAWWLIPLVAKRDYSIDFGVNWTLNYGELARPFFLLGVLPPAGLALLQAVLLRRQPPGAFHSGRGRRSLGAQAHAATLPPLYRFVWMHAFMLAAALFLFRFGYRISPVFVNVRLWPFITYSLLAMAAAGLTLLVRYLPHGVPALGALSIAVLLWGTGDARTVMRWSEWNFDGLEHKAHWPVFRELVLPLRGTPGRLANDLHPHNESFGSSRIFEATPHLTGKPILEGGIVNSAAGSLFAYYIQSETSDQSAGYPPIVKPTRFDFDRATKHLQLFNVKHFLAHSPRTREALTASPDWALLNEARGWSLYELTTHDGRYVFVPDHAPRPERTADWKQAGLDWIYGPAEGNPFRILLKHDQPAPKAAPGPWAEHPITAETVDPHRIAFTTRAVGAPHMIRVTYFPNWRVRGADRVYQVTPCFMLVYPTRPNVELYYGSTLSDTIGRGATLLGILVFLGIAIRRRLG